MIEQIITASKIFLLSYTISRFSPLQMLIEMLPNKIYWNLFKLLMSCSKCLALWSGIIMTGNIWISMVVSILMVVFEKTFGEWERKTKLY